MVSERSRGIVVMVGNRTSPHLKAWIREAEELGWRRMHIESHGAGLRGMLQALRQVVAAHIALARVPQGRAVVQAHGAGRAALFASALVSRHPTVVVHGSEVLLSARSSYVKRRVVAWALNRAGEVIVTAPSSIAPVVRLAPAVRSRIRTVHPGADWDRFVTAHVDRRGPIAILSNRRMLPLYRILDIVRAFGTTSQGRRLILLRGGVSSEGAYAGRVVAEVSRTSGNISTVDHFLGESELVDLYSNVDIAVSTAESDQLSVSILEALAAGCVVVLSDLEAYSALRDLPHVVLVATTAGPGELAAALQQAEAIVRECGRDSSDRSRRAELARQAFEEAFGSDLTILPAI